MRRDAAGQDGGGRFGKGGIGVLLAAAQDFAFFVGIEQEHGAAGLREARRVCVGGADQGRQFYCFGRGLRRGLGGGAEQDGQEDWEGRARMAGFRLTAGGDGMTF
ncbi:hypothetical protein HMPREF9123_0535 [Neisseria bacilliformis ATCC BAA-1200]|uniref:Uncharacterized protein n=1 Tax=Neisseria bacilliformis ATCC BAA-1200 TaxID=888742 RepID=F2BA06_9NEIS|nr:hypothetical protein HMPREF9123_0535 [Neisseria bacilliformis ATCC BAA-1200]